MGTFSLLHMSGTRLDLLLYSLGLLHFCTYKFGTGLVSVLYNWIRTGLPSRGYPANVFKKLRSRRETLSFTKSIPVLLKV